MSINRAHAKPRLSDHPGPRSTRMQIEFAFDIHVHVAKCTCVIKYCSANTYPLEGSSIEVAINALGLYNVETMIRL